MINFPLNYPIIMVNLYQKETQSDLDWTSHLVSLENIVKSRLFSFETLFKTAYLVCVSKKILLNWDLLLTRELRNRDPTVLQT